MFAVGERVAIGKPSTRGIAMADEVIVLRVGGWSRNGKANSQADGIAVARRPRRSREWEPAVVFPSDVMMSWREYVRECRDVSLSQAKTKMVQRMLRRKLYQEIDWLRSLGIEGTYTGDNVILNGDDFCRLTALLRASQ